MINSNTITIFVVSFIATVFFSKYFMMWCKKLAYSGYLNKAVQICGKNTESRRHSNTTVRGMVTFIDNDSLHISISREEDIVYTNSDERPSFIRDGVDFKYKDIIYMKKIVPPTPASLYGEVVGRK